MNIRPSAMLRVTGNKLFFNDKTYRCAVGRGGFARDKREGDGKTPVGIFSLRECWYRADKLAEPETRLTLHVLARNDGWCDDPAHPSYNRHVKLPFAASHETLWRDDDVYDVIVPLGYNDDPVVPGKGSAIFLHLAQPEYAATEGCVALSRQDMLALLAQCGPETCIVIEE